MARRKLFYPKSQISEPRMAKPGEFLLQDGTPYNGPVHEANGIVFPGAGPHDPPVIGDTPLERENNANQSLKKPQGHDQGKHSGRYWELTKAEFERHREPISHLPRPTASDFKKGTIRRFFVQKINERMNTVTEISSEEYDLINGDNSPGINAQLYDSLTLNWSLDPVDNYQENLKTLRNIESDPTNTFIGLNMYLTDLREFAKTTSTAYTAQDNLFTNGNEFRLPNGRIYIGPYHIHRTRGPMVGSVHTSQPHEKLTPIDSRTIQFLDRQDEIQERTYPDGEKIPKDLPLAYQEGKVNQFCNSCIYFSRENFCAKWGAKVREGYWCESWRSKNNPNHAYQNEGHTSVT